MKPQTNAELQFYKLDGMPQDWLDLDKFDNIFNELKRNYSHTFWHIHILSLLIKINREITS